MSQESIHSLQKIQNELKLIALVHFTISQGIIKKIGDDSVINAIIKSNLSIVLRSDMPPMPIRFSNGEIYEMVLQNDRGLVAKEGRANRYLVALKIDTDNVLAAIGDNLDPGIVLFEFMQYRLSK